jgi:hypothetical protein
MTQKLPSAAWVLIALMSISFAFCILVPLFARADIPDLFSDAVKSAFDTFATPLGASIGFVFSARVVTMRRVAMPREGIEKPVYSSGHLEK